MRKLNLFLIFLRVYPTFRDADQLTQVFQNLLENAMKYGRPKSEIRIKIA